MLKYKMDIDFFFVEATCVLTVSILASSFRSCRMCFNAVLDKCVFDRIVLNIEEDFFVEKTFVLSCVSYNDKRKILVKISIPNDLIIFNIITALLIFGETR